MNHLSNDNWQHFVLGGRSFSRSPSTSLVPTSLPARCESLVESGNLSKSYQLLQASSLSSSLSPQERITQLRAKHPPLHTASFTPQELASVHDSPIPDPLMSLPPVTTDSILLHLRSASKGTAPGFDLLRYEHLHALTSCHEPRPSPAAVIFTNNLASILNLIQSGTISESTRGVLRDAHIIAIPKSATDDRPIGLQTLYRKIPTSISIRSLLPDLRRSFQSLQFGVSPCGTETVIHSINIIHQAHPDYDVYFADGINAFNSASRIEALLQLQQHYPEAYSYAHQFYGSSSSLWHDFNPPTVDFIPSSEGFQQGDPASTLLYCLAIHNFLHGLQTYLLSLGPCLPLFFVDDGTIIGPHEIVVAAISYINEHGPRVGYRLNTSKGRLLLGQCASSTDALQHRQSYLDLGFLSSVLLLHPSNTNDPNAATSYGFKLLGSYVGSDEFILNSLNAYLLQLQQQANRPTNVIADYYQHLLVLLRHCFLTKPSQLFRTIPPHLTLHLAEQVNALCVTVFCSMLSNQHPDLSPLHAHQLHLHVDDGGFSLPDMLLVRDCGYSASFTQCLPDILGILSLLQPVSINDISLSYQHHCDPTVPLPSAPSFFNAPHPSFTYFYAAVTNLHSLDPSIDLQSLLSIHRHESKLQHFLYERCYQSSLSSFRQSLNLHADPVQTAHYYTLIGSDFNIWPRLTARFGFYTMPNPIFQSALLRRLNLSQPSIPAGLTCACARKPIIDTLGRHFTTGCALHGVRQSTERSIVDSLTYICHYSKAPVTSLQDRHILRSADETENKRPDLTVLNAPHYHGPLLIDVSIVQAYPGSMNPTAPLPRTPPDFYPSLHNRPQSRTASARYNFKVNKYQVLSAANGVSFLPFIMESNGYIHPNSAKFLLDLAHQASFFHGIPWQNLLQYFHSILSVSLQSALSQAILTHSSLLHPPSPTSFTLTDADIMSSLLG